MDGCDWVILAVLPEQANAIVGGLKFRPEQVIINFISTLTIEQTYTLAKEIVPRVSIVKVVPLPPVARHQVRALHKPVMPPLFHRSYPHNVHTHRVLPLCALVMMVC